MSPPYRVLIVDDSENARRSLVELMAGITGARFDVRQACDGVDALTSLGSDSDVDLVITDLAMPRMDGLALVRHLRALPAFVETPILMLTSHTEDERKIEVFKCGATDYVVKPFLAPELEARILGYLERKRAFETIRNNVEQARATQEALLPQRVPTIANARLSVRNIPAEHLSGDLYDFYELSDGRLGIMLADVSGHGISAALITFLLAGIFRNTAQRAIEPNDVLATSAELIGSNIPERRHAAAMYAVFDPGRRRLTYSAAGHPPGLLMRRDSNDVKELVLPGTPLGLRDEAGPNFEAASLELDSGDTVVWLSDGLIEAPDPQGQPLGLRRIKRFMADKRNFEPDALLDAIIDHVRSDDDSKFADDVTLIALQAT